MNRNHLGHPTIVIRAFDGSTLPDDESVLLKKPRRRQDGRPMGAEASSVRPVCCRIMRGPCWIKIGLSQVDEDAVTGWPDTLQRLLPGTLT